MLYFLLVLLFLFTGVNLEWQLIPNRELRLMSSLVFLIAAVFLVYRRKNIPLYIWALPLLVVCDLLLLYWETGLSKNLYYPVHSVAVLLLIRSISKEKTEIKIPVFDWIYLGIISLVLSWIIIALGQLFSEVLENPLMELFFYFNGFSIVVLVIATFFFSAKSGDRFSSFFFLAVLGLAISDLLLFTIYFMDYTEFRYVDNLFYIFGVGFLLSSITEDSRKTEENFHNEEEEQQKNEKTLEPEKSGSVYF